MTKEVIKCHTFCCLIVYCYNKYLRITKFNLIKIATITNNKKQRNNIIEIYWIWFIGCVSIHLYLCALKNHKKQHKKTLDGNGKMRIKTYAHIWVESFFYSIRKNLHKLWWKHIYRINSSMRIKKVMWLCALRRDNLANQWTNLVHSIYKLLWSFWNAWGKSVI